jgi:hypothetical protein
MEAARWERRMAEVTAFGSTPRFAAKQTVELAACFYK